MMTNNPRAFISCPIPYPNRQRVFVAGKGPGFTQAQTTLAGTVIAFGVLLDSGSFENAFPSDVLPYDDSEPGSVVYVGFPRGPLPVRLVAPVVAVERGDVWS